jgi:hypothetical protein
MPLRREKRVKIKEKGRLKIKETWKPIEIKKCKRWEKASKMVHTSTPQITINIFGEGYRTGLWFSDQNTKILKTVTKLKLRK